VKLITFFSFLLHDFKFYIYLPLFEISIWDPVWKTLSANTNTLQDTVTPELVQHKMGFH